MDAQTVKIAKKLLVAYVLVSALVASLEIYMGLKRERAPSWGWVILLVLGLSTVLSGLVRLANGRRGVSMYLAMAVAAFMVYASVKALQGSAPSFVYPLLVALGVLKFVAIIAVVVMVNALTKG